MFLLGINHFESYFGLENKKGFEDNGYEEEG